MGDINLKISIPADDEGYVSFECPFCGERFKLKVDEFKEMDNTNLFCPMCGLTNEISNFYSKDVVEKAMEIAEQYAMDLINKMFKDLERSTRGNSFMKVKAKEIKTESTKVLYENDDELVIEKEKCCERNVKIRILDKFIGVYCPYCGGRE